jgi:acyl-coenzyme A synthetase/AMP-(fatty) acid ligase
MMKLRTSIAAMGAAVALGTSGALVLPAVAASAAGGTHTLAFVSVQGKSVMFSKASGGQQDTDVNAAGKTVGFDMLYFVFTSGSTGAVSATIETTGGFLYGTFTFDAKNNTTSNGKVTGGTGAFAGATGTIKTKSLNAAGTRTAVTVTYRG